VQKLHIKAARDSNSVGSLYNINYVSQKQCNRYIMCNGTSCSLLLKKKKPLFELETRSSKHTIMHKKVRIITPQQAYTTGRMEVLYRVFVRKYIGKNKVKLDTKSGKYYDTQKA
jgi:hypothetical protein